MNMKAMINGVVSAAAAISVAAYATESVVEALSSRGYAAYDRLINARTFGSGHGYDRRPTDDLQSHFQVLSNEPNAIVAFERMAAVGSAAARMYGLYGLRRLRADEEFERAAARLVNWRVNIEVGGDDTGSIFIPIQDLIKAIAEERVFEIGATFGIRRAASATDHE